MRRPSVLFSLLLALCTGLTALHAQTVPPAPNVTVGPEEAADAAQDIATRAERLKAVLAQVNPQDWIARGAPQAYLQQWQSLVAQNASVASEMAEVARFRDPNVGAPLPATLSALFRLSRFNADLQPLLAAVRRYESLTAGDSIESLAAANLNAVDKLQRYALESAQANAHICAIMDEEAQRCRSAIVAQPAGSQPARKTPASK